MQRSERRRRRLRNHSRPPSRQRAWTTALSYETLEKRYVLDGLVAVGDDLQFDVSAYFSADTALTFSAQANGIELRELATGLESPLQMLSADDGSGRIFVVEQTGRVRILQLGSAGPDLSAPMISNVFVDATHSDAIVSWTSDEATVGYVAYGTTPGLGNLSPLDASLSDYHRASLPDLVPETQYYLQVVATDAAGNATTSQQFSFVTEAVPVAGEVLYNGIVLPQQWPPAPNVTQLPQVAPYLITPPDVINIDVGRQLFVDDFLIAETTLSRSPHRPQFFDGNPILTPGDAQDFNRFAMVDSGGVVYDPDDGLFKIWYTGSQGNMLSYAYSTDGMNWIKPELPNSAVFPNSNTVLRIGSGFSSTTVRMDPLAEDPNKKFVLFAYTPPQKLSIWYSPDGIEWTADTKSVPAVADRSTMIYNPFRDVWVSSMRSHTVLPAAGDRDAYTARTRSYSESTDLTEFTPLQFWTGPDLLDPIYYAPYGESPELYNLDAVAYESVMVGMFTWWNPGVPYPSYDAPGPRVNELGVGFSRDGYHWERPTRGAGEEAFLPASNETNTWNGYNTQSAAGNFLVVGDELWFYFSGRSQKKPFFGDTSTGMAKLRRDGFYSMDASVDGGTLTTRPLQFSGQHLFVNVNNPSGQLQVEVLDLDGNVIAPFSKTNSIPVSADKTLVEIQWAGAADLSALSGSPVRFRFHLNDGELYSFWVSDSPTGASNGYVAAGGPGLTGPTDTVGNSGYVPSNDATNEQNERIVSVTPSLPAYVQPDPFLDVRSSVVTGYGRGIQSIAFHPQFDELGAAGEGKLYVYYHAPPTTGGDHDSVVSEFRVSTSDPDRVDEGSERVLLRLSQPAVDGNQGSGGDGIPIDDSDLGRKSGSLVFGPRDGLLYISIDGGYSGEAQDLSSWLGKVLRIDVDGNNSSNGQYGIPPSNPFVSVGGALQEIYAYGFNHPRHLSFDDGAAGPLGDDRLFATDVGYSGLEEVNLVVSGGNYGWEALSDAAGLSAPIDPVAEYRRTGYGEGILGGQIYAGSGIPMFSGRYLLGDSIGQLKTLSEAGGTWQLQTNATFGDAWLSVGSIGEQVYVSTPNTVYQLATHSAALPDWLSLDPVTGIFSGTPAASDIGTVNIDVTATDARGDSVTTNIELTVTSNAKMTVSIVATDSFAAEPGDDAEFTITRSGEVFTPLTVRYSVSGTALPEQDYAALGGSITIPVGQDSVSLPVEVINDSEIEFSETVIISLRADGAYDLSTGTTATATILGDQQIPDVLVAHWALDETSGVTAADQSAPHYTAALDGGPQWTLGRIAGGLQFDGFDDSVDGGIGPAIVGTAGFSVAGWIRTSAAKNQVMIQQRSPQGYNGEYMLELDETGIASFWTYGASFAGPTVASTTAINDGRWHHVAGVREDDGTTRIYIDGALESSIAGASRPLVPLTVYLGADKRNNDRFFDGKMDDLRIYNRALTAADVQAIVDAAGEEVIAVDDFYSVDEDTVLDVLPPGLLQNDQGSERTVIFSDSSSEFGASVTRGADGSFQYDPRGRFDQLNVGQSLDDRFSYTVSDGVSSDVGTVTVTIAGLNDAPTAENDNVATDERSPVTIAVLQGDTDVDSSVIDVTSINDSATVGSVTLNPDDTVTYSPNGKFDDLNAGESASDTFEYTISDDQGATSTAQVTVLITGVTSVFAAVDDSAATDEDSTTIIDLFFNDTGQPAQLTITSLDLTATVGLVTLNSGGTITYDPNNNFENLAAGDSATDTFSYTILNGVGGTSTATVTISLSGVNDQPVAADDAAATDELDAISIDLLRGDSDPDSTDILSVVGIDDSSTIGTVTLASEGTVIYDPDDQFDALQAGQTATDSFGYLISDGNGGFASATVVVTINGLDAPSLSLDGLVAHYALDDGAGTTAVDVSGNGYDANVSGNPVWSSGKLDGGLDFDGAGDNLNAGFAPAIVGTGGFTVAAWVRTSATSNQVIVQQRSPQQFNGEYQLHVTPSGQVRFWTFGGYSHGPFVVSGERVNDGIWHHVVGVREDDGTSKIYIDGSLDATGTGPPRPLQPITVYIGADMRGATNYFNGSLDEVRIYDRALAAGEVDDLYRYTPTVQPDIAVDDSYTVNESSSLVVAAPGLLDNDNWSGLSVTAIDATSALGATVIGDADGAFQYLPGASTDSLAQDQILTDSFSYTVSDGTIEDVATVTVRIVGLNDLPIAVADSATTNEDTAITVDVLSNDSDPDAADSLSIDSIISSGTLGSARINPDGSIAYDPAGQFESLGAGQTANDLVTYTVTDSRGGFDTAVLVITIQGVEESVIPTAGLLAHWSLDDDSGTIATDQSGNEHHATVGGNPIWSSGIIGGAIDFDGSGDHLNAGTGPAIVGRGGFTVAAWVRTTARTDQVIVQQRSPAAYNGQYQLHLTSSGKARFWTFGGAYGPIVQSSAAINDGQWHHVVGVRQDDGTTMIYVDGTIDGSKAGAPRPLIPINVYLGADMRGRSGFLTGSLDDVRIYDRALDDDEISDLINAQSPSAASASLALANLVSGPTSDLSRSWSSAASQGLDQQIKLPLSDSLSFAVPPQAKRVQVTNLYDPEPISAIDTVFEDSSFVDSLDDNLLGKLKLLSQTI